MPDPSKQRRGERNLGVLSPLFLEVGVPSSGIQDPHTLLHVFLKLFFL